MTHPPVSRIVIVGAVLATAAAAVVIGAGFGTRMEWWHFRTGFSLLRYGAIVALVALAVLIWAAFATRPGRGRYGFGAALLAMAVALPTVGLPLSWMSTAKKVPMIHDISTDLENPPAFAAVLPLRGDGSNPVPDRMTETAAQQRAAYPDVGPFHIDAPPADAFDRALAAARDMGWEIVAADRAAGRFEATATTFWFGFKDDIAVRVTPDAGGSRVDVRSISRVGRSDVGTNAARIRAYLQRLRQP